MQVLYNWSFIDQETDALEGEMPAQWGHGRASVLTQDGFPPLGSFLLGPWGALCTSCTSVGWAWPGANQHLHQQYQPPLKAYLGQALDYLLNE